MGTKFSVLIDLFFKRIEKDKSFFHYFELADDAAMKLAEERAKTYLYEAIGRLMLQGKPTVDFTNRDDKNGYFNFDLTDTEKLIIPSLMYEYYLDRDVPLLKLMNVNYTPTEMRVFDPTGARNSFMNMYKALQETNATLIDNYKNTDRISGEYRSFDFSKYDTDEWGVAYGYKLL